MFNIKKNSILFAIAGLLFSSQLFGQMKLHKPSIKTNSSTIAVVNGEKISQAELDAITSDLLDPNDPDAQKIIKKSALNNLINQALVIQELDKNLVALNAEDMLRLEYLKKNATFNFLLNKIAPKLQNQPEEKLDEYIRKHPKYFQDRKTYHFIQYQIDNTKLETLDAIKSLLNRGQGLSGLTDWLTHEKIAYKRANNWYGGDQIELRTLNLLDTMKSNTIYTGISPDSKWIEVIELEGIYPDPVSIEDGRVFVAQGVGKEFATKGVQSHLNSLRAKAQITISDDFLNSTKIGSSVEADINSYKIDVTVSQWITAIWSMTLLFLVPATSLSLYRQYKIKENTEVNILKGEFVSAPHSLLSVNNIKIPIFITLSIILLTPLFFFVSNFPAWMNGSRFASSLFMGAFIGNFIILIILKFKPLQYFFRNKWVAVLCLGMIEIGQVLISQAF